MMYRIEFSGRLLEGFDPQFVRSEVGTRLHLRDTQIDRLFSGQTVVLKKAVSEANSQAYLEELRTLGLDAQLVPIDVADEPKPVNAEYKVVYWGKILPGFERAEVMKSVARRLRLPPGQLLQVFSGAKVVLKRGISAEQGARLVVDMALLGMQIELEVEASAAVVAAQPTPKDVPVLPAAAQQEDDPQYGALLRTACDLSGTPFAGYDTSSNVAPDDDAAQPQPVIPPPITPKVGYSSANTDGYLNCPNCGFYQPRATTCAKCTAPLPKPAVYVGRAERDLSPTTRVNPADVLTVLVNPLPEPPKPSASKGKAAAPAESLYDQMYDQDEQHAAHRAGGFPILKIAIVLLVLGGVIAVLLLRH